MFFDEDDKFFGGKVEDKFFDVVHNASRSLVKKELSTLIEKLALYEKILTDNNIKIEDYNKDDLEDLINDYYINSMGNILSHNE